MADNTSSIRDNLNHGKVGDFLLQHIKPDANLSIVSAYFTIHAFAKLQTELEQIQNLRFLFGEPTFVKEFKAHIQQDRKSFTLKDEGLALGKQVQQKTLAKECAAWIRDKVEIRSMVKPNFLHGKLYHIHNSDNEKQVLLGSSNFTVNGLGLGNSRNIELNIQIDSNREIRELKAWFDELWESPPDLVEDVKEKVLEYLSLLYQDNAPEFVYFKTLFHLFKDFLDEQEAQDKLNFQLNLRDTEIWETLFEFQKDGVKGAVNKLEKHNGCIIADSVGLGKTYSALAVIKYTELRRGKVLVLCPKKLKENWTIYNSHNTLNPFQKDNFNFDVLCHTDLGRDMGKSGDIDLKTVDWGNYDLVVIDESHNFRNVGKGKKDETGQVVRKSRSERLMEDIIKQGRKTKVLLLSATPVNNDLKDLRNQIRYITEGNDAAFAESLGIANLQQTLKVAQQQFTVWAKKRAKEGANRQDLMTALDAALFKLLDALTIARSRKHILSYYPNEMERIGGFPDRAKPVAVSTPIDTENLFPDYDTLNEDIHKYKLSLFNPSQYVLEDFKHIYEEKALSKAGQKAVRNFSQADRENYLIGMMKVNFLKRLESSVVSFRITMERTMSRIDNLIKKLEDFKKDQEKSVLETEVLEVHDEEDDELQEAWTVGKKFTFDMKHLRVEDWLKHLQDDKKRLARLFRDAQSVTPERDAKLQKLKALIEEKVQNPTLTKEGKPNKKVLVFTAFADTASYLYESLQKWAMDELGIHLAMVSGGAKENKTTYGRNEFNEILTHFSPLAKKRAKQDKLLQSHEIDLLIATDCISEGQNLQDCDYLVNYDIHWNPVRVIQRFGRIDRIGSVNKKVHLVNFWATDDLDKYINLKNRVEARMALVDLTATNQDNILDPDNMEDMLTEELQYRDQQLLRLKNEILDLEDLNDNISLSDFSLDDFRMELLRHLDAHREKLENAPEGIFAVVPKDSDNPAIQSLVKEGVILCLRHKNLPPDAERINPLQPYFLVYIRNDGTVRFAFSQAKQTLDLFRLLCVGKDEAYEELCRIFDARTDNGNDMAHYNELISKATESIGQHFRKKNLNQLQTGRGAQLVLSTMETKEEKQTFELVTWLVVL